MFDILEEDCLLTSGKTGLGLDAVLPSIVERIPPPPGDPSANLRLLLFDAFHDEYRWARVRVPFSHRLSLFLPSS